MKSFRRKSSDALVSKKLSKITLFHRSSDGRRNSPNAYNGGRVIIFKFLNQFPAECERSSYRAYSSRLYNLLFSDYSFCQPYLYIRTHRVDKII